MVYMYIHVCTSRFGGWVVDGFPLSRENWAAMIEHEVLPDTVLTLDDEETPADTLLTRFTQQHGLPHPSAFKQKEEEVCKHDYVHVCTCTCRGVCTCKYCTCTCMCVCGHSRVRECGGRR